MIVAGRMTDWWIYLLAPVVGGTLAATLYDEVLRRGATPS
jgi:glycerol uptake facilitator-like aquaporin